MTHNACISANQLSLMEMSLVLQVLVHKSINLDLMMQSRRSRVTDVTINAGWDINDIIIHPTVFNY